MWNMLLLSYEEGKDYIYFICEKRDNVVCKTNKKIVIEKEKYLTFLNLDAPKVEVDADVEI